MLERGGVGDSDECRTVLLEFQNKFNLVSAFRAINPRIRGHYSGFD